ncbi:allene oxide cyclase family protein [Polyangium spumosum]|uniref:allene-oxide cyclase n=1 Tax=Polyangium spumosum TaxID=889282 RepID=A0A6N7PPD4_9BACT|nr:allene oxide cyclase family protein [Polyangium spumosum]MRG94042.1 Allene oxide cyclase [Polyangium spumosum]
MRKASLMCAVLASAALVGCGDENGAPAPDTKRVTIELVEHVVNESLTDHPPMGDSAGDVLTFANQLFNKENTTQVGTDQGYCLRVDVGKSFECTWTAFLADGQITVNGPFFDTKESTLSITGGTGAYAEADGYMELGFRDTPMGTVEYDFVYQVILPY